jgi:hypothetical protein
MANVPQQPWSVFDAVIEAIKIVAALFCLFFIFDNPSVNQLFHNVVFEWHWGRFLVIAIAYLASKKLAEDLLRHKPIWEYMLWVFYSATVIALVVWSGYGTHTEDADPLFGGGTTVVDFVPTEVERDLVGSRLFLDLLIPALLGAYLSSRAFAGKSLPSSVARVVTWTDVGIGVILEYGITGVFYVGILIVSGVMAWMMGSLIVERSEFGWYLLYAIPMCLLSGLVCIVLAFTPLLGISEQLTKYRRRKSARSSSDQDPPTPNTDT